MQCNAKILLMSFCKYSRRVETKISRFSLKALGKVNSESWSDLNIKKTANHILALLYKSHFKKTYNPKPKEVF